MYFLLFFSLSAGMLRVWDAIGGHKAIWVSLCIKILLSHPRIWYLPSTPFFLSGHKSTSPCARCSFFTGGIKIINNSALLFVSHLWIIHHTIPAGYCLLLMFLIPLFCWKGGNLIPYLQNRSPSISSLVSVFVSLSDNWIHFLGAQVVWCKI